MMVGVWSLTCPRGGKYEGECSYDKKGRKFVLECPTGLKVLKNPKGESCDAEENPRTRVFLPHGLTECEKEHGNIRRKLSSCIKKTEIKCCGKHTTEYSECSCNPVAVCRASVSCP